MVFLFHPILCNLLHAQMTVSDMRLAQLYQKQLSLQFVPLLWPSQQCTAQTSSALSMEKADFWSGELHAHALHSRYCHCCSLCSSPEGCANTAGAAGAAQGAAQGSQQRHIGISLEYDDGDSVWCPQLTGDFKAFAYSVVWAPS